MDLWKKGVPDYLLLQSNRQLKYIVVTMWENIKNELKCYNNNSLKVSQNIVINNVTDLLKKTCKNNYLRFDDVQKCVGGVSV